MRTLGLAAWLLLSACVNPQLEKEKLLSGEAQELLGKYRQFMTQRQIDEYLAYTNDADRHQYVESLRVGERLAVYSKPIQDAIWAKNVISGMDKPALLLSWGTPRDREFSGEGGNEIETWVYRREQKQWAVVVTNGYVTDVIDQGFAR